MITANKAQGISADAKMRKRNAALKQIESNEDLKSLFGYFEGIILDAALSSKTSCDVDYSVLYQEYRFTGNEKLVKSLLLTLDFKTVALYNEKHNETGIKLLW